MYQRMCAFKDGCAVLCSPYPPWEGPYVMIEHVDAACV